ncbi:hypothetical protein SA6_12205, partial [Staphylococcus epidermidis]
VAEDDRRDDQPKAEQDACHLLPAMQRDIFELGEAQHQHADHEAVEHQVAALDVDDVAHLHRKPGRDHDQHA